MNKLFYIQPLLPSYRFFLVRQLAASFKLSVLCGQPSQGSGFGDILPEGVTTLHCPHIYMLGGRLQWQQGVLRALREVRPDRVLACANTRDITFWILLIWCRMQGIKVFAHGQGLYAKRKVSLPWRLMYRLMFQLVERYIAYTSLSRDSLLAIGAAPEKVVVADNSIQVASSAAAITKTGMEAGVLFLGRLRRECKLEQLVTAVGHLRAKHPDASLHVIGGGELEAEYRKRFNQEWVIFHGVVYDDAQILDISRECRVGCYPGNAGLSVVHYFALRLPAVVHDDMPAHMGPEPSYLQHRKNGMLFNREHTVDCMTEALQTIWNVPIAEYQAMSTAAFAEYERLNSPSLGEKIVAILRG